MDTTYGTAEALWQPAPERIARSNLKRFQRWLFLERGIELKDAGALFDWSIRESEAFWNAIAAFFGVRFHREPTSVLEHGRGPGETRWFPGATLNYAEHLLRFGPEGAGISDQDTAVLFCSEYGTSAPRSVLTRAELLNAVSCVAAGLKKMGVGLGDRVVGYLPEPARGSGCISGERQSWCNLVELSSGTLQSGRVGTSEAD